MNKISLGRGEHLLLERDHDMYRSRMKPTSPTLCTVCGAVFVNGRWGWSEAPEDSKRSTCPACHRVEDHFPAGHIELRGDFFAEHQTEILNLIHNIEMKEKRRHSMERIMKIEPLPDGMRVMTTGIHLARGIGDALAGAYKGKETIHYLDGEQCVRVRWSR